MQFAVSIRHKMLKMKNRNQKRAENSALVMSADMLKIENCCLFVLYQCWYHTKIFADLQ